MHFITAIVQNSRYFNVNANLMHAILRHCYFRAPLFHYDSSIGSSGSLFDRTVSFKIEFKGVLIDLDTGLDTD